jgi:hypothetical protein
MKEHFQELYDDLYSDNIQFKKLLYDVFENNDISKNQTLVSRVENGTTTNKYWL